MTHRHGDDPGEGTPRRPERVEVRLDAGEPSAATPPPPAAAARRPAAPGAEPGDSIEEFRRFRERMNREILDENNLVVNRFFALDGRAYEAGALDVKTKELLGLVASVVLRCDDCITYHLARCREEGVSRAEIFETLSIGLVVGGSIVVPHMRRAVARWSEIEGLGTEKVL